MRHCKNCMYCELDLVSQYVKGVDYHVCVLTHKHISEPFWEGRKCKNYCKRKKRVDGLSNPRNFIHNN